MTRRSGTRLLLLVVAMLPFGTAPFAGESGYYTEDIELGDTDIDNISAQVLAQHPLLSSSPGIKAAGAARHFNKFEYDLDTAWVVFHPHTETAGIKQAYQVSCVRQVPDTDWMCEEAMIRRYLALETQDFEVRITGPIDSDAAMALIEATRQALPPELDDGSAAPETAINILPTAGDSEYLVVWGSPEGYGQLMMQAQLADGADATLPEGWQANVFVADN